MPGNPLPGRWPQGFECPECGRKRCCRLRCRNVFQCTRCRHQVSLTAGTVFANTKLPLTRWFLAMYLLTQSKNGLSAMALGRQLGVSYNTAWSLKHKLMQVMKERDESGRLGHIVQVDDAYLGGETRGGKRGRGAQGKTPFVAAVQVTEEGRPVALRMSCVKGFRKQEIAAWAQPAAAFAPAFGTLEALRPACLEEGRPALLLAAVAVGELGETLSFLKLNTGFLACITSLFRVT